MAVALRSGAGANGLGSARHGGACDVCKLGGDDLKLFCRLLDFFFKIIWIICGLFFEKCSVFSSRLFQII